ncbi:MAG TPA: hypothetical protein VFI40_04870 [Nocardioides sp.]|nr:hypothetical protein [Nocardioides sp.]
MVGQQFDVRLFENTSNIGTAAHGLLGQCDIDSRVIKLARQHGWEPVGADSFTETFLHECLHGLISVAGLNDRFPDNEDEPFVDRLAPMLLDFIRRNKSAIAWLQRRD